MRFEELQESIITLLTGYAPLTTLLAVDSIDNVSSAIFDHVDQNNPFPYISVGEPNGVEHDADDITGWTGTVDVRIWSRFRGFEECNQISRQVDAVMHRAEPSVTDARIVTLHRESVQSLLDPDGLTRSVIVSYRVILEEL